MSMWYHKLYNDVSCPYFYIPSPFRNGFHVIWCEEVSFGFRALGVSSTLCLSRKLISSLQPLRHCRYQILTSVLVEPGTWFGLWDLWFNLPPRRGLRGLSHLPIFQHLHWFGETFDVQSILSPTSSAVNLKPDLSAWISEIWGDSRSLTLDMPPAIRGAEHVAHHWCLDGSFWTVDLAAWEQTSCVRRWGTSGAFLISTAQIAWQVRKCGEQLSNSWLIA